VYERLQNILVNSVNAFAPINPGTALTRISNIVELAQPTDHLVFGSQGLVGLHWGNQLLVFV
jgi:hypothetical protein